METNNLIEIGIALSSVLIAFGYMKGKINTIDKDLEEYNSIKSRIIDEIEDINNKILEIKSLTSKFLTAKEVREEFVSKEMFQQLEKHMDEKFSKLEMGLEKILEKLNG